MKDPIVEEVRAAREALSDKFKFDVHTLAVNARRRQAKSGHKEISCAQADDIFSSKTKRQPVSHAWS
jgi:hypothetical protein